MLAVLQLQFCFLLQVDVRVVTTEHAKHFYNAANVPVKIYSEKDEWEVTIGVRKMRRYHQKTKPRAHWQKHWLFHENIVSLVLVFSFSVDNAVMKMISQAHISQIMCKRVCWWFFLWCRCGHRCLTLCCTLNSGAGLTYLSLPHWMPTLLEKLQMEFVTTYLWVIKILNYFGKNNISSHSVEFIHWVDYYFPFSFFF